MSPLRDVSDGLLEARALLCRYYPQGIRELSRTVLEEEIQATHEPREVTVSYLSCVWFGLLTD